MKRLIIAVDCDDVLVPSTAFIVRAYNDMYGTDVQLEYAHTSGYDGWRVDSEEATRRIHDIQLTEQYGSTAAYDEAVQACRRLAGQHELHIVTARAKKLAAITDAMIEHSFQDVFTSIEHLNVSGDKGVVCQRLAADVLIDDNLKHLERAAECGVTGLIWFGDYAWQVNDLERAKNLGVRRCLDWDSVEKEIERLAAK